MARVAPPAVEVRAGDDVGGDARVEEVHERLVVGEEVAAPGALLERVDLLEAAAVLGEERVARVPVALDERAAQEELAREDGIDAAVGDGAPGDDRQPVERHALGRHDRRATAVPARLGVGAALEVPGQRLDPRRIDARDVRA